MSKRLGLLALLTLIACEEAPKVAGNEDAAPAPIEDQGPRPDVDRPEPDVGADAAPVADTGLDMGDMGDMGDGGEDPDAGPISPVAAAQIGVAADGPVATVVWAEDNTIKSKELTAESADAPALERLVRETPPTQVVATVAGGAVWAVLGDDAGAEILRVAAQGEAPLRLDLRPPLTAAPFGEGGTRVIVFGLTDAGHVGWQVVTPNDPPEVGPVEGDERVREVPSSVARGTVGDIARFDQAGMCQVYDEAAQGIASIECLVSPGAVLGDGGRPILVHDQIVRRNGLRQIAVSPVFDFRAKRPYAMANAIADAPRFAVHGGYYPLVGQNNVGGDENQGKQQLYAVRTFALLESEEAWDQWPYDALGLAIAGQTAWVIDGGEDGRLQFNPVPLVERDFGAGSPLRLPNVDADCTVRVEVCEDRPNEDVCEEDPELDACDGDEDCDDVSDNGLCCDRDDGTEKIWEPHGLVDDVMTSVLYANQLGYRFAVNDGAGRWAFWYHSLTSARPPYRVHDCSAANCPNGWSCEPSPYRENTCKLRDAETYFREAVAEGAYEGYGLYGLGDFTAFIARDADSAWRMWWYHPSRALADAEQTPPKAEPELIGCSEILAADVVENDSRNASMIVVCTDRMVRMYPDEGRAADVFTFAALDIDPAQWATITLSAPENADAVTVLIGTRREQTRSLKSYIIDADLPNPQRVALPEALDAVSEAGGEALDRPITIHRISPDRPAVQLAADGATTPRILTQGLEGPVWRELALAPEATRVAYAKGSAKVVAAQAQGESTAFWVVDVDAQFGVTPWASAPVYVSDAPVFDWEVAATNYSQFLILFIDNEDGTWRVMTRRIGCGATGLREQP